jgi:hypothetical protein
MYQATVEVPARRVQPAIPPGMSYRSRGLDGRSRIMKRAAQLAAHYTTLLDQAGRETTSVPLATAIISASELVALAEHARTRLLRGELGVTPDDVVRMQRLADLSVRRLHLGQRAQRAPTLDEYLASHPRTIEQQTLDDEESD